MSLPVSYVPIGVRTVDRSFASHLANAINGCKAGLDQLQIVRCRHAVCGCCGHPNSCFSVGGDGAARPLLLAGPPEGSQGYT